ncbi:general stress protein [Marinicrinis sediminis]|uniref:General stress protein n=1 Tax=Marinicrinis sediminis TaxID=1652465 RepID=A0ABW5R967_9BACL
MSNPTQSWIGVFQSDEATIVAIEDLKASGVHEDQISIVTKNQENASYIETETGAESDSSVKQDKPEGLLGMMWIGWPMRGAASSATPGIGIPGYMMTGPMATETVEEQDDALDSDILKKKLSDRGFSDITADMYIRLAEKGYYLVIVEGSQQQESEILKVLGKGIPPEDPKHLQQQN